MPVNMCFLLVLQAMHGAPMYIAETAPSKVRGTLISLKEAFIVGGILVSVLDRGFEFGQVRCVSPF
jgi:hypothetical protein